ncbi:sigma 54-interacting transcriptional regulator [Reinekea marinisedimentorum]|uniref:Two-component system response regulator GlrR n=1 Tax=Reinekea marinisedimentorum TaxID=230495 RepID=A0A4R3I5B5_9GAMM|nr:sigma 54-interacting transcriptional regulator [Reinekea marinisedimentorum]TCS41153.1 two-component system response regulator GlrR [Reinekea marinisedimentorum]
MTDNHSNKQSEAKPAASILLVDDDAGLLKLLSIRLRSEGYRVSTATSVKEAIRLLADHHFSVVLSDLRMPGQDGLFLLEYVAANHPSLPVILITAHGSIDDAVIATEKGALGFITKPIDHAKLKEALTNAISQASVSASDDWDKDIIYRSDSMHRLMNQAALIASRDVSVLISGASGTGKELLAKAVHAASPRSGRPFIAINCGALPEHLLESELFGHKKGAFSGAVSDHIGLFRAAEGGTLFLDEIGDMPVALQVKLLRVLQEKALRPVGSTQTIPVDVRVISATHKDLKAAMDAGEFREDLYYRVCVVNLRLPGLNERQEDIPVLARHLLAVSAEKHKVQVSRFSDEAMLKLCQAHWPGNIRQLVNVVEQCVALTASPVINLSLVNQALINNSDYFLTLNEAKEIFERSYISRVLKMTDGVVSRAAELAGRNRTDFYKLIKKHDLCVDDFKQGEPLERTVD